MADAANSPGKRPAKLAFDERAKGILRRFITDWIWPARAKVLLALLFTAGLAATTGGYPLIIKHSFDSLMKPDSGVLPLVPSDEERQILFGRTAQAQKTDA